MSEAQKRAQARRAKILARGGDGLAQLAKTARGEEGAALYDTTVPPVKPTEKLSTPTTPASAQTPSFAAETPDAYQDQMENMMRMLGGGGGEDSGGMPGMPDMAALQAMLGGSAPGANQSFPTLMQGPGQSTDEQPPSPFSGFPGMAGAQTQTVTNKPRIERFYPLIHALSTVALFLFVTLWWEPAVYMTRYGDLVKETPSQRYKSLIGTGTGAAITDFTRTGAAEALPVFWAFTTVQLLLQTTRFLIFKSPPAPHSLLRNFLPFLPPTVSRPLLTGSRYLSLIAQTWKDGCLFIALLGLRVAFAAW